MSKQFMLITMNKQKIIISENQEKFLRSAPSNKMVRVGETTINTSIIASIIPLEEYYRQNPNEKTYIKPKVYTAIEAPKTFTRQKYLNVLKSILKGCRQVKRKNAQALADKMEAKYKEALREEQQVYANPVKDFYKAL